jgi:acyl carrier protein phosphodiesterase
MNFLAHAHLSGNDEKVIIGNFIADRVKGNSWKNYPHDIQKGILLHRFIDDFTDSHTINKNSSRILQPYFGKYSGVVTDVVNDHFLSVLWSEFHHADLSYFISFTYDVLKKHETFLPEITKQMVPIMISQDWLGSYIHLEGIADVLRRMSKRTPFESGMEKSLEPLQKHLSELKQNFIVFYPELIEATRFKLQTL